MVKLTKKVQKEDEMSVILQVNYGWDVDEETAATVAENAERYNEVPGLRWKLWIRDPESKTSGGIHLFVDRESAEAYLNKSVLPVLDTMDGVTDISTKILGINAMASRLNYTDVDRVPAVRSVTEDD